jgi:hypothetical protein
MEQCYDSPDDHLLTQTLQYFVITVVDFDISNLSVTFSHCKIQLELSAMSRAFDNIFLLQKNS